MKNKKKTIDEELFKNQSKKQKKQIELIKKKSPSKIKNNQSSVTVKSSMLSSLNSSNYPSNSNKQSILFYGKKYRQWQLNNKKVSDSNQSSTHCSINRSNKQKSFQNKKNIKTSKSSLIKDKIHNNYGHHKDISEQEQEDMPIQLNSQNVMHLINNYAIKIQRQWRRYWFRKCVGFLILKQRELKKYQLLSQYYDNDSSLERNTNLNSRASSDYQPKGKSSLQIKRHAQKRHTLPKLASWNSRNKQTNSQQQEIINNNQQKPSIIKQQINQTQNIFTECYYNNKKYGSASSMSSLNNVISNRQIMYEKQQKQKQISLEHRIVVDGNTNKNTPEKIDFGMNCSFNDNETPSEKLYFKKKQPKSEKYQTPVNQLRNFTLTENSEKLSQEKKINNIKLQPRVFQCKIVEQPSTNNVNNIKKLTFTSQNNQNNQNNQHQTFQIQSQKSKQLKRQSTNQCSRQEIKSKNFQTKFPLQQHQQGLLTEDLFGMNKIFKKCKKVIQTHTKKSMLGYSKKYQDKQITERTYKKLLNQTKQKASSQLKSLQLKQGAMRNDWTQVLDMFKEFKQKSFRLGQQQKLTQTSMIHEQNSLSLEQWDFQSSAKKSISQLQSFEEFARELNSRNPDKLKGLYNQKKYTRSDKKSIQLVLQQLDELDGGSFSGRQMMKIKTDKQSQLIPRQFHEQNNLQILGEFRRDNFFQKKQHNNVFEEIRPSQKIIEKQIFSPKVSSIKFVHNLNQRPKIDKEKYISQKEQKYSRIQKEQKQQIQKCDKYQFPELKSPTNSFQRQQQLEQIKITPNKQLQTIDAHIKTDQSEEEDSSVELRITSCQNKQILQKQLQLQQKRVNQKQKQIHIINQVVQTQNIQTSKPQRLLLKQQITVTQKHQTDDKSLKTIHDCHKLIQNLAIKLYQKHIQPLRSSTINELSLLMVSSYKQKQFKKQQQLMQLKKYPPTIDATIDAINTWLLEISHYLLDNHNAQIKQNLVNIKQIPKKTLLQICQDQTRSYNFNITHPYETISELVFKQFEFFHMGKVAQTLDIPKHQHTNFQNLIYAFHRSLIDCMNMTLIEEISVGKNWNVLPWLNTFRYRKLQTFEHTKQCLQRAINRVSVWGEYCIFQSNQSQEVSQNEWKQYQEQKLKLIVLEQVLQYPIENDCFTSNLIFRICNQIIEDQMRNAAEEVTLISQKRVNTQ